MPDHVRKMSHGGMACMSCGGAVGEHGYAMGGEFDAPDESDDKKPMDDKAKKSALVMAIMRRKHK